MNTTINLKLLAEIYTEGIQIIKHDLEFKHVLISEKELASLTGKMLDYINKIGQILDAYEKVIDIQDLHIRKEFNIAKDKLYTLIVIK